MTSHQQDDLQELMDSMIERRDQRSCGTCTACCTVMAVPDYPHGKPAWERCPSVGPGCCMVYSERPTSCRTYQCSWLEGLGEDHHRPDKFGVVMNFQGGEAWKRLTHLAWGPGFPSSFGVLVFRECWHKAAKRGAVKRLMRSILGLGLAVAIVRENHEIEVNGPATKGWVRTRWQDTTPT